MAESQYYTERYPVQFAVQVGAEYKDSDDPRIELCNPAGRTIDMPATIKGKTFFCVRPLKDSGIVGEGEYSMRSSIQGGEGDRIYGTPARFRLDKCIDPPGGFKLTPIENTLEGE